MAKDLPPFYRAAKQGSCLQLECFLKAGVPVDSRSASGDTALSLAASNDREEAIQLLLSQNADINSENSDGDTVLHQSVLLHKPQLVKRLLEAGANPKATNARKQYPLHLAVKSAFPDIVEILLNFSPDCIWASDVHSKGPWEYCKTQEMKAVFIHFYMWKVRKGMILLKDRAKVLAALPLALFRSAVEFL